MIIQTKEQLVLFLSNLPKESDRDFEKRIVALCTEEKQEQEFYIWAQELADTEFSTEEEEKVAFAAFCIFQQCGKKKF